MNSLSTLCSVPQGMTILRVSPGQFGEVAAEHIMASTFDVPVSSLALNQTPCLVLPTSRTALPVFEAMRGTHAGRFQNAFLTHQDEYVFTTRIYPERFAKVSFSDMLRREIVEPCLGDNTEKVHLIDPYGKPMEEALKHDEFIREAGGVTTMVVGPGRGPALSDYRMREVLSRIMYPYIGNTQSSLPRRMLTRLLPSIHLGLCEVDAGENSAVFSSTGHYYLSIAGDEQSRNWYLHDDETPLRMGAYVSNLHPATVRANKLAPLGIKQDITMSLAAMLCAERIFCIALGE